MKKALFWQKLIQDKVQCELCYHRCVIALGKRGLCGVRENQNGILYSLVYGKVIAEHIDPIEKKPLFHFLPGSNSYSLATVGCNFRCQNCQNADISQASKEGYFFLHKQIPGEEISPRQIIERAKQNFCESIAYTYTEPTIFFEYARDIMKLAKKNGLKNIWVSNGYISEEPLRKIAPYLDAANIDLKFFSSQLYQKVCGARLEPILENLKLMKKLNIWLEITTLLIPELTEKDEQIKKIAEFIQRELGEKTPWHISAFFPAYQLQELSPTLEETIHKAYQIAKKVGLKYVYGGNLPYDELENTYCPKCQTLVIKRLGYDIHRFDNEGQCEKCGENLDLILK